MAVHGVIDNSAMDRPGDEPMRAWRDELFEKCLGIIQSVAQTVHSLTRYTRTPGRLDTLLQRLRFRRKLCLII